MLVFSIGEVRRAGLREGAAQLGCGIGALPQELIAVADGGFDGDCAALGNPNRQRLDHRDAAWCVAERIVTDLHPAPSLGWDVERDERRGGAELCVDAVEAGGGAADFVQRGVGHEDRVGLLARAAQARLCFGGRRLGGSQLLDLLRPGDSGEHSLAAALHGFRRGDRLRGGTGGFAQLSELLAPFPIAILELVKLEAAGGQGGLVRCEALAQVAADRERPGRIVKRAAALFEPDLLGVDTCGQLIVTAELIAGGLQHRLIDAVPLAAIEALKALDRFGEPLERFREVLALRAQLFEIGLQLLDFIARSLVVAARPAVRRRQPVGEALLNDLRQLASAATAEHVADLRFENPAEPHAGRAGQLRRAERAPLLHPEDAPHAQ